VASLPEIPEAKVAVFPLHLILVYHFSSFHLSGVENGFNLTLPIFSRSHAVIWTFNLKVTFFIIASFMAYLYFIHQAHSFGGLNNALACNIMNKHIVIQEMIRMQVFAI
jgi:hypothetical protein